MFRVGDRVRLLGLPDWLIHDLPESEQREMRMFVGQTTEITGIDVAGHHWVGFGQTTDTEAGSDAHYAGHSFCVTPDFLQRA
jgi:hypothetical protein